jgi:hypothetical protein
MQAEELLQIRNIISLIFSGDKTNIQLAQTFAISLGLYDSISWHLREAQHEIFTSYYNAQYHYIEYNLLIGSEKLIWELKIQFNSLHKDKKALFDKYNFIKKYFIKDFEYKGYYNYIIKDLIK